MLTHNGFFMGRPRNKVNMITYALWGSQACPGRVSPGEIVSALSPCLDLRSHNCSDDPDVSHYGHGELLQTVHASGVSESPGNVLFRDSPEAKCDLRQPFTMHFHA